jgi:hypothetical protein
MPSDLDTMPVPLYHSGNGALDVACMAASAEAALVAPPPAGGVDAFAVRSGLRTPAVFASPLTLQRCAGIAVSMMAWIVMLAGLAHLCVAALRNREGELGLGLDATIHGAQACLLSLALGALGVPLWALAELRLRRQARVRHEEQPTEAL